MIREKASGIIPYKPASSDLNEKATIINTTTKEIKILLI
jgi:hypothetical protein